MDSINKEQQEHNRENLAREEAVSKLKELVEKASSCFFCTSTSIGPSDGTRPMGVLQVDDDGNLWFLSSDDSYKNKEIAVDPNVKLYFQGSAHSDFLFLSGRAMISRDKAKIKELWKPLIKTWFTEGENDPRITVIPVAPNEGYYWDTKHGKVLEFMKMAIGAMSGKTVDDSVEGKLVV